VNVGGKASMIACYHIKGIKEGEIMRTSIWWISVAFFMPEGGVLHPSIEYKTC
jgi:hypothetical protein